MDKIKAFFEEKKLDKKFKKAGVGHTLGTASTAQEDLHRKQQQQQQQQQRKRSSLDQSNSTGDTRQLSAAAIAAQARIDKGKQPALAGKRIKATTGENVSAIKQTVDKQNMADKTLKEFEMSLRTRAMDYLDSIATKDPIQSYVHRVKSMNGTSAGTLATTTLNTYIDNTLSHPGEEKFLRIRKGNKAFQERIVAADGALDLLKVIGFQEDSAGEFLTLPSVYDTELLRKARDVLDTTTRQFIISFNRPITVSLGSCSDKVETEPLSSAFFEISVDDIRREQAELVQASNDALALRTKAMRDGSLNAKKYRYCNIRVIFPDNSSISATFHVQERVSSLFEVVLASMVYPAPFSLKTKLSITLEDPEISLADAELVPSAVLNFTLRDTSDQPPNDVFIKM